MSLIDWCNAMNLSECGRVTINNMHYDCTQDRLDKTRLQDVTRRLEKEWDAHCHKKPVDVLTRVQKCLDDVQPEDYLDWGPRIPKPVDQCSRVMGFDKLREHNLDPAEVVLPVYGRIFERAIKEIMAKPLTDAVATNAMRTERPFAWVTKTESILTLKREAEEHHSLHASTVIMNALGLADYTCQTYMVEIKYPDNCFECSGLSAPTFLVSSGCKST